MHSQNQSSLSQTTNSESSFKPHQTFQTGSFMFGSIVSGILVLVSFSAATEFVAPKNAIVVEDKDHRSIREYRQDVKAFMKLSKNDDEQIQRNAIYNLCVLHQELVADPRFETSSQVQSFRVVVANRLEGYSKEFKKKQAVAVRLEKKHSSKSKSDANSNTLQNSVGNSNALDTTGLVENESVGGGQTEELGSGAASEEPSDSETYAAMHDAAAESYSSMAAFSGGPNNLFGYAGGRFAPPWDHGPELVALITSTIDPSFWRQNGGNGAIHYFRPLGVLVIGATTRVHQDTNELLLRIRQAGR